MRKIRIMEHISIDGIIQQENGEGFTHGGWTTPYRTPAGLEAVVYPVLLGRGKRFFSDSANPRELAFLNTKVTSTGVLINTYQHLGPLHS
ncbi:hypothetical protein HDE69_004805 [Pedobacter cryoconitis]|uniref:RibD domain-containing protein n=1 Tax=Pedobacter cryoconitis TaxID=188932 RepID=A0A7W8YXN9_9SPHI|nr:hypothetical protein [Pedobacter cryoconitis]MBB5623718.1 hypothetical protein [Pedobacter cryoconitis]